MSGLTAEEIAQHMDLSVEAVRAGLARLEARGLVRGFPAENGAPIAVAQQRASALPATDAPFPFPPTNQRSGNPMTPWQDIEDSSRTTPRAPSQMPPEMRAAVDAEIAKDPFLRGLTEADDDWFFDMDGRP